MTNHTPGPWHYDGEGEIVQADGDVFPRIAQVDQSNVDPVTADFDGRLIAAAPDILAALKEAAIILEMEMHARGEEDANHFPSVGPALAKARAAIAKAEGRT